MINVPRTALYCVSAAALALAAPSTALGQGMAMEKGGAMKAGGQVTIKTIAENEKLLVTDGVSRPGDVTVMQSREG